MKDYARVLKFITKNRRDMDDITDENLARELYKFFYGKDCTTCANEKTRLQDKPCWECNPDEFSNWSPK